MIVIFSSFKPEKILSLKKKYLYIGYMLFYIQAFYFRNQ